MPIKHDGRGTAYSADPLPYSTHAIIARAIGRNKSVLDIGCNKGYLKAMSSQGNVFWGIDVDSKQLAHAKKAGYEKVFRLDLNDFQSFKENKKFSVIIFADVLEHLLQPKECCSYFVKNNLADGGRVIISLPNVANLKVRIGLLLGRFDYTETGILDRTHLHLYTLKSGSHLVKSSGLEIERVRYGSDRFGWLISVFPFLGSLLGHGLIFICRKS